MGIPPIRVVIQGVDRFSATIGKSMSRLNKLGQGMQNVGRKMSMMMTAPIIAGGALVIRSGINFEKAMNKTEAKTQATTDQMSKMRDMAKDLGIKTKFSAVEAGNAMAFLGMAGWNVNKILQGTPALLDLAAASEIDLARAADIASNIMGAFEIEASRAGEVADILAATTAGANVDMEMLAETMKQAGPPAHAAGASLKDVAVAAGFLGNMGIQGSQAGTAMKNMFLRLAAPAASGAQALKAMGIQTMDAAGNLRPYADLLKELAGRMSNLGTGRRLQVLDAIFGKRVIAGAAGLTSDITRLNSGFASLSKELDNVAGSAKRQATIMQKGAAGAWDRLRSSMEGFAIAIGESGILDMFVKITTKMTNFFRRMAQVSPKLLKFGTLFLLLVSVIGPLLVMLGMLISAFASIGGAVASAGGIMAILLNPIAWTIIAIGALIAVLKMAGLKWQEIWRYMLLPLTPFVALVEWVIERWGRLLPFFKLLFLLIGWAFKKFVSFIEPILSPFLWLLDKIIKAIKMVLDLGLGLFESFAGAVLPDEIKQKIGLVEPEGGRKVPFAESSRMGMGSMYMPKQEVLVKFDNPPEGTKIERIEGDMDIETTTGGLMPALGR